MKSPIPKEVTYIVYCRQVGCEEWFPQECSDNKNDAIYWRDRNNKRNSEQFEKGAGRKYIALKKTITFEVL